MSVLILLAFAIMFLSFVSSASFSSTSVSNARYYSTTSAYTAPSGFQYSDLISGINAPENEEEFYDLMITILPGGCKPMVVRSDLLEEQNVPVFCELTAVKINPGVDISRIARISVKNLENNPYIAGVGFYPARAAIRSTNTLSGSPVANNIGYAVVVLKRTETENAMPSNITTNLSAMFEYDAVNGFGIGVNEMYLPVMTDDEFTSRQKEYGFFNGIGYLRVDSMDQNSAVVSIYDSQNRRLFSQRLEKDKTSREFRIPTSIFSRSYENQAVTLTLKEITIPQTSAKIMVNDGSYVVYKNGKFADKCTLTSVISSGGGTGTATINCGGKTVTLEKKFNKINLLVNGAPGDYALGDKISLLNNKTTQNYYVVYAGNVPNNNVVDNKKTFIFLAKEKSGNILTVEKSWQIAKDIESQINKMDKGNYYTSLGKIKSSSLFSSDELILVYQGEPAKNASGDSIGIEFKEAKFENAFLTGSSGGTEEYYNKAKTSYDDIESKFPNEINNYIALDNNGQIGKIFGELSLWSKYELAFKLNQQQDVLEILSEIRNSYPNSKNIFTDSGHNDQTAEQIMADSNNLLSSEGASTFIEDQNLYLELVSVNEPSESEASVELTYSGIMNSQTTTEQTAEPVKSENGEATLRIGQSLSAGGILFSVKNISAESVNVSYSCTGATNKELLLSRSSEPQLISGCDVQVTVIKINSEKSNVSLKIEGIKNTRINAVTSVDSNKFTFLKVNKDSSGKISDINVYYECGTESTKSDGSPFKIGEEISSCKITIKSISEDEKSINITYKLSSTTSTPQTSSTETKIGTEEGLIARQGEKFVDVGNKIQITLKSFTSDKAIFTYSCNNSISNRDVDIKKGSTEILFGCDNAQIRVNKINLKEVAKVELNPKIRGRIREANFTFSIGIEKRSDFLLPSPEEMNKQIKELDETINKWKNTTEKLGTLVKGMKAACLATSGALTLKNWATGLTGEAAARHEVMTRQGGWNDICKEEVAKQGSQYSNVDQCLLGKNSEIEKSVEETTKLMQEYQKAEEARLEASKNAKGVVDPNKAKEDQLSTLKSEYSAEKTIEVLGQDGQKKTMKIGDILGKMNISYGDASSIDLRELELNLQLMNSNVDENLKNSASKKVENLLNEFEKRSQDHVYTDKLSKILNVPVITIGNKNTQEYPYTKQTWSQIKDQFSNPEILTGTELVVRIHSEQPIKVDMPNDVDYLVVLSSPTKTDEKVHAQKYYKITEVSGGKPKVEALTTEAEKNVPTNFVFKLYDAAALKNPCKNCDYAEIFNSEPYKGYPSLLPFDNREGWYVSVRQNIASFGNLKSYQDSGALSSFYLCNVGSNGMMEGDSIDYCQNFNINTADANVPFSGLTLSQTNTKLAAANNAIRSAQDQLARNPSAETITINNMKLKVKGVQGTAGGKCTDFMSAQDCNIMFNVCDPVVCPSSRCNMGGAYTVDNVIQSGIIGSVLLCLPNIKERIFIPVCLTGIHAGMTGWISIMQAHRDCLNESLATNRTVGICDEIYSVYQCDFMWKQVGPFVNAFAKNALSGTLFGAGSRGGGEYMFVNQAFSNAENSWQYFTSSYASDSSLSFGARSFSEIGSEVCKAKLSATYPDEFGAVLEPDSPVQIYAFFDESSYTDATVPPTSSYKVYYHIFAGNDNGRYYQVYLKTSTPSIGVLSKGYSNVASGYIAKGETIDQTRDFLDNSGFKELCVRIDTKDYCGFKSVTTDFAINYAKDKALQDQANNQVTTESECVSGSASVGAFITPNIQQGVEQAISPDLYNQGIVRVCASQNPGASVNPARWTEVGYCDNTNIKCWIDGNSVQNAIQGKGIENATLQQINALGVEQLLTEGMMTNGAGNESVNNIIAKYPLLNPTTSTFTSSAYTDMEKDINAVYNKMIFSSQKAALLYYKAMIYDRITRNLFLKQPKLGNNAVTPTLNAEESLNLREIILEESQNQGINYVDALKIAYIESGLSQINAPTSAGALGVMQVTPIALEDVNLHGGILRSSKVYSQEDLLSAQENIEVGIKYLGLIGYYVDNYPAFAGLSIDKEAIVVASYNAGFTKVTEAIGKAVTAGDINPYSRGAFSKYLPEETKNYLVKYYSSDAGVAINALTPAETTSPGETTMDEGREVSLTNAEFSIKSGETKILSLDGENHEFYLGSIDSSTDSVAISVYTSSAQNTQLKVGAEKEFYFDSSKSKFITVNLLDISEGQATFEINVIGYTNIQILEKTQANSGSFKIVTSDNINFVYNGASKIEITIDSDKYPIHIVPGKYYGNYIIKTYSSNMVGHTSIFDKEVGKIENKMKVYFNNDITRTEDITQLEKYYFDDKNKIFSNYPPQDPTTLDYTIGDFSSITGWADVLQNGHKTDFQVQSSTNYNFNYITSGACVLFAFNKVSGSINGDYKIDLCDTTEIAEINSDFFKKRVYDDIKTSTFNGNSFVLGASS